MAALRNKFPGNLISKFGEIDYAPRFPDLTSTCRDTFQQPNDPRKPKIKRKELNKQRRFCNSADCHGLDGRKDAKMFDS